MSNLEHLIENAISAVEMGGKEAFDRNMKYKHNEDMLKMVEVSKDDLWEIAQYIVYVHDTCKSEENSY